MALFYLNNIDTSQPRLILDEDESRHCLKTLRKNTGDTLHITDGKGLLVNCRIKNSDKKNCVVEIIEVVEKKQARNCHIHVASSLTKNLSRMEFFLEKAVEIGLDSFSPLKCKYSERVYYKADRFHKIAVSAMKQSFSTLLPHISDMIDFKTFINESIHLSHKKYIAFQAERNAHLSTVYPKGQNVLLLIGPEGDFSQEEINIALDNGFEPVSLGTNRLRTETAALYACSIINAVNA